MDIKISLNNDWFFVEHFDECMIKSGFKGECVRLPHTVRELPFSYCNENDYQMLCAYSRELFVQSEWAGQSVRITFEGAAHQSVLYCNGVKICEHKCGYTAFTAELCDVVKYGESNTLLLVLDTNESSVPPFGNVIDYLTYGGIYREVSLSVTPKSYIKDVFCYTPKLSQTSGELCVEINTDVVHGALSVYACILDKNGRQFYDFEGKKAEATVTLKGNIENIIPWTCENPELYTLRVSLLQNGEEFCRKDVRFGFRTCRFDAEGFYLNGKKLKIFGLNRHQSWPYVGYAMPRRAQRLDAHILKYELGLNAVRTSHYPQSQHFIDACDELGLLVFTEIPGWQHIGDEDWQKIAVENVRDMVIQYRNHPSVILWGVRINESQDDNAFYTKTNAAAHELDPSRQTGGVRCITKSSLLEDVYTYNDFFHNGTNAGVSQKSTVTPDLSKGYLITEYNGHMYPTKTYDDERRRLEHLLRHAIVINDARQDGIAGSFGWCAFDYNTHKEFGSGDRICHHGVMDMFRNPKPAAHIYKSQSDNETELFVSSEMNIGDHPVGSIGDVWAVTNADSVRLYKNEELISEMKPSAKYPLLKHSPICIDDFVGDLLVSKEGMSPSTSKRVKRALNAISKYGQTGMPLSEKLNVARLMLFEGFTVKKGFELYNKYMASWGGSSLCYRFEAIKDGKPVLSIKKEPVYKTNLIANVDTSELFESETYDLASVRLSAVDQNNNVLYYCMDAVEITVYGALETVGPAVTSLRGGMGGAYFKTIGETGKAKVKFKAPCGECELEFEIK